jgi:hypothetical protein
MKVLDPGHYYALEHLDKIKGTTPVEHLGFVKRIGPGYPGNVGSPQSGTNVQEVLRALIDRLEYVDRQVSCTETKMATENLRSALLLLELRAARRHGRFMDLCGVKNIESCIVCWKCGHIGCDGRCHT